jgi:hypothetical protein
VVQHDPVVVVADLGLVTELDWFTEPAFGDRVDPLKVSLWRPRWLVSACTSRWSWRR